MHQIVLVDPDEIATLYDSRWRDHKDEHGKESKYIAGHSLVFSYIPPDEIWISEKIPPDRRKYTIIHELSEHLLMEEHGFNYNEAHNLADKIEEYFKILDKNIDKIINATLPSKSSESTQINTQIKSSEITQVQAQVPYKVRVLIVRRDGHKQHYWVKPEELEKKKREVEERGGRMIISPPRTGVYPSPRIRRRPLTKLWSVYDRKKSHLPSLLILSRHKKHILGNKIHEELYPSVFDPNLKNIWDSLLKEELLKSGIDLEWGRLPIDLIDDENRICWEIKLIERNDQYPDSEELVDDKRDKLAKDAFVKWYSQYKGMDYKLMTCIYYIDYDEGTVRVFEIDGYKPLKIRDILGKEKEIYKISDITAMKDHLPKTMYDYIMKKGKGER